MPAPTKSVPRFWLRLMRGAGNRMLLLPREWRVACVALWMGGIWLLSSQQQVLPAGADSVGWVFLANLAHAPLFGLLGMWVGLALLPRRDRSGAALGIGSLGMAQVGLILLIVLAYGSLDEWHQSWVPGRHATPRDLAVDFVGAACVLWVAVYLGRADAHERGLRRRLQVCLLVCCGATLLLSFAWT